MRLVELCVLVIAMFLIFMPAAAAQSSSYYLQAGAWGDASSQGNMGVQVRIRTHIYVANTGEFDYFWVGDNLDNGAFIQFGYAFEPGHMCLLGQMINGQFTCPGSLDNIGSSDARWQWQYWPNKNGYDFYFGIGSAYSAGIEGSWHTYSIMPNVDNGWDFVLDGQPVASLAVQSTHSKDPAYFVAEKAARSPELGKLGPVELADLSYLKTDGWHSVSSLTALVACAVGTNCNIINPYGVSLIGPNDVMVGSGIQQPQNDELLWSETPSQVTSLQVGAWGDDASIGNSGVRVDIRTRAYALSSSDLGNAFWVGDNLNNGAFIQFGYELFTPGHYCLYGERIGKNGNCLGPSDYIESGDARWFWEYWPNATIVDFYSGIGPANSAGPDDAWHTYQIAPNVANGWNFVLDGQILWSFNNYQIAKSKDAAFVVGEEVPRAPAASGNLGPVEFRNLEYFSGREWYSVKSLNAISGCGALTANCGISIPYGVSVVGSNDITVGTGLSTTQEGYPLWSEGAHSSSSSLPAVNRMAYLAGPAVITLVIVIGSCSLYAGRRLTGETDTLTQAQVVSGSEINSKSSRAKLYCRYCGSLNLAKSQSGYEQVLQ